MVALHKAMPISGQIFDNFNNAFIAAVAGAGVTAFDQATIRLVRYTPLPPSFSLAAPPFDGLPDPCSSGVLQGAFPSVSCVD